MFLKSVKKWTEIHDWYQKFVSTWIIRNVESDEIYELCIVEKK